MKMQWIAIGIFTVSLTNVEAMADPTPFEQAQARVQAEEQEWLAMDDVNKLTPNREIIGKNASGETQTTTIDETGKVKIK